MNPPVDRVGLSWYRTCFRPIASVIGVVVMAMMLVSSGSLQVLASEDTGTPEGGEASAVDYQMSVLTAFCENQTAGPLFGCYAWEGVEVFYTVESQSGSFSASCVTVSGGPDARAASCLITMPYGAVATVSIDPSQVPAGYVLLQDAVQVYTAPDSLPDGVVGGPIFTLDLADSGTGDDGGGGSTQPSPTRTSDTNAPIPADAFMARIMSGSCEDGFGGLVADLTPVALGTGEVVGQPGAIEMATSDTTIPVGLDGIIDGPSAVVISLTTESEAPIIACGDIGGVNDRDGELVVMLLPYDSSSYVGTARLAYNTGDGSQTDVTIYVGERES